MGNRCQLLTQSDEQLESELCPSPTLYSNDLSVTLSYRFIYDDDICRVAVHYDS